MECILDVYAMNMVYKCCLNGVWMPGGHFNTMSRPFVYHVHGIPFTRCCKHLNTIFKACFLDIPKPFEYHFYSIYFCTGQTHSTNIFLEWACMRAFASMTQLNQTMGATILPCKPHSKLNWGPNHLMSSARFADPRHYQRRWTWRLRFWNCMCVPRPYYCPIIF